MDLISGRKTVVEAFTNSVVEFTSWADFQPGTYCFDKGFGGLKINLNHTDTKADGYHCTKSKAAEEFSDCETKMNTIPTEKKELFGLPQ